MSGRDGFRTFGTEPGKEPPGPALPPSVDRVTPGACDVLKVACAADDTSLHLVRRHKPVTGVAHTLCGLATCTAPPDRPYLSAGCVDCSQAALAVGIEMVRDTGHAFVSLRRAAQGAGGL